MGQRQQYLHGPETSLPDYKDKALGDADAETTVLQAYRQRAGLLAGENFPPEKDPAWQLIMRAGLNAIDEQCEKYIDAIFWANRDLRTAGSEINLAGATTATMLGIVGAPAAAIATTAAAFGFATQGLTNISNGLFYKIEPSGIRKIVHRSQTVYRQGVEERLEVYNSRPAAVNAIQGYLSLCLPASIETQINEAVAASDFKLVKPVDKDTKDTRPVPELKRVVTEETTPVATVEMVHKDIQDLKETITKKGSSGTESPARAESTQLPITDPNKPLPPPRPKTPAPNRFNFAEVALTTAQIKKYQRTLCVAPPDGDLGQQSSATRKALAVYLAKKPSDDVILQPDDISQLNRASEKIPDCRKSGFLNAYEVRYFGVLGGDRDITTLQEKLNKDLGRNIPVSGKLDPETRGLIKIYKDKYKLPVDNQFSKDLDEKMNP
jgi:hypothetical protein